jgi:hypothetical protein
LRKAFICSVMNACCVRAAGVGNMCDNVSTLNPVAAFLF